MSLLERTRTLAVLFLTLSVLFAGCTSPQQTDANDTDGDQAEDTASSNPRCQSRSRETQRGSQAQMVCQNVSGAGTQTERFQCDNPNQSALRVATNLTDGAVTIRVLDGVNTTVFEKTYDTPGGENESARINDGETGPWDVVAERTDAFQGSYAVGVACAR